MPKCVKEQAVTTHAAPRALVRVAGGLVDVSEAHPGIMPEAPRALMWFRGIWVPGDPEPPPHKLAQILTFKEELYSKSDNKKMGPI